MTTVDPKRVVSVLEHAREAISEHRRWTQNSLGHDSVPEDQAAVPGERCYCLITSVYAREDFTWETDDKPVRDWVTTNRAIELIKTAVRGSGVESVFAFNDSPNTTHEMVLEKMDLAIELAKKEAAQS